MKGLSFPVQFCQEILSGFEFDAFARRDGAEGASSWVSSCAQGLLPEGEGAEVCLPPAGGCYFMQPSPPTKRNKAGKLSRGGWLHKRTRNIAQPLAGGCVTIGASVIGDRCDWNLTDY